MERTALDCARWLPRMEAVAILDQFARRDVDLEALWHRPFNSWHLRDTLGLADRGAASPRESWLRVILVEGGLPRPTTQIRVELDDDRCAYLDLGWEEFKVAVEYDGQEHHTSPADQQRDTDRREELRRRGWRVIAVRRDVIPGQIADLLHHVANALIECGWQPGPERTNHILRRIRAARRRSRFRLISHPPSPTHHAECRSDIRAHTSAGRSHRARGWRSARTPLGHPRWVGGGSVVRARRSGTRTGLASCAHAGRAPAPGWRRARTLVGRPHRAGGRRRAQMPARRRAGASDGRPAAVLAARHAVAVVGRSWRNVGPGRAVLCP
ncbi:DUF559 domain-containing protein [Nonomuraea angiospora]|uniref:DUF559 domain-containing protein n=1 Tax=Nonomuraea angiospora TaxID=46172 RepID=UPI0033C1BDF0